MGVPRETSIHDGAAKRRFSQPMHGSDLQSRAAEGAIQHPVAAFLGSALGMAPEFWIALLVALFCFGVGPRGLRAWQARITASIIAVTLSTLASRVFLLPLIPTTAGYLFGSLLVAVSITAIVAFSMKGPLTGAP